jgi:cytochrome c peroxidase
LRAVNAVAIRSGFIFRAGFSALLFFGATVLTEAEAAGRDGVARKFAREPIRPIPLTTGQDKRIAALGALLFEDTRLSGNDSISCSSCHDLDEAGTDDRKFSMGIDGKVGVINAPTVFNTGLHNALFWDGRAATLEEQIDGPVNNPVEMGSSWPEVIGKLRSDNNLRQTFDKLFPSGITKDTISIAIATFERTLITANGRFDRYLRGQEGELTQEEKRGYILFKNYGCSSCHQGAAVGGNIYEKMGVHGEYFRDRGNITKADYGRYNVTGKEEHKFEFKVPSLRNVARTAPYFHDGTANTLEEAVSTMARYQLGRVINSEDLKKIVAFLKTLDGDVAQ